MNNKLKINDLGGKVTVKVDIPTDSTEYQKFLQANRIRENARGTSHEFVAQQLYIKTITDLDNLAKQIFDKERKN